MARLSGVARDAYCSAPTASASAAARAPTAHRTIRDAILTRAQKLTQVSLIYRTEIPKTEKWKKKKNY